MPERQKTATRKPAGRKRSHQDDHRAHLADQVRVRRKICSFLHFWQACGHKECLRARVCALASNECFERFWPHVPEQIKISIRAGMEARAAGLSPPEIGAAIARAQARWQEIQALHVTSRAAPQPVEVAVAPAAPGPRVRAL